jgi:hypothetical protein
VPSLKLELAGSAWPDPSHDKRIVISPIGERVINQRPPTRNPVRSSSAPSALNPTRAVSRRLPRLTYVKAPGLVGFKGATLAGQLQHIDAVLVILGFNGDPSQIVMLRRKPNRFRRSKLYRLILKHEAEGSPSNRNVQAHVQAKGCDAELVKIIRACINTQGLGQRGWPLRRKRPDTV